MYTTFYQEYLNSLPKTRINQYCRRCPEYTEFCDVARAPVQDRFCECEELQEMF